MRRGEVRIADLDPVRGGKASKRRPAIVVSNDRANATAARLGRGVITVVPLTSNVARVFPFQVLLPAVACGLRVDSKAQCEQIRSVAVERLGPALGQIPASIMGQVDEALRLHLGPAPSCAAFYHGPGCGATLHRSKSECPGRD